MTRQRWTKILTVTTILLVSVVAVTSFVLSYRNLVQVALEATMSDLEANLWPVLIDFPLLVFSVAGILARITRRRHWPYLGMVVLYSGLTMYFNAPIPHSLFIVYLVAPLSFILSFETITSIVSREAIKAKVEVKSKRRLKKTKAIEVYEANGHNLSETARELDTSRYQVKKLLENE